MRELQLKVKLLSKNLLLKLQERPLKVREMVQKKASLRVEMVRLLSKNLHQKSQLLKSQLVKSLQEKSLLEKKWLKKKLLK